MPPRSSRRSAKSPAVVAAAAVAPPTKARKGTKRRPDEEADAADPSAEAVDVITDDAKSARKMARTAEGITDNPAAAPTKPTAAAAASGSSSAAASSGSPACFRAGSHVLYRDALQSMLRFLGLSDVSRLLRVCRGWSGAVRAAPSVHGHFTPRIMDGSSSSLEQKLALARSIVASEIGSRLEGVGALPYQTLRVDCALLEQMARRMPALRSLAVSLVLPLPAGGASPHFPPALQCLALQFEKPAPPRDIHQSLFTIAANLKSLHTLTLWLPHAGSKVHFNALTQCAALRHFTLVLQDYRSPLLSAEHLASLKLIGPLLHSLAVDLRPNQVTALFAGSPHPFAQLQELRPTKPNKPLVVDAVMERALSGVPSLTRLHALWKGQELGWLAALPLLRELRFEAWASSLTPEQILQSLGQCAQLTSFELVQGPGLWAVSAEQIATCIAGMPNLQRLGIDGYAELTSLSFLANPAASKLSHVRLFGLNALPPAELRRLSALPSLRRCEIEMCCESATAAQLRELVLQAPCYLETDALVVCDMPSL